ncbi:helix-turn-helix domain-containing protein [Clostridium manihotivorum]|uniref:XRE family transcriptional regulator n=1 Tax=Clostridium manihotivorum TaxID=2320868 RepID=A0A410DUQ5_9CLOT|nr:helix-turn-helix transcriptional regulator [Clostridium manihotivorum]ERI90698.1 DNA-binding helix-turn-helix protein [Clostridiales bacterium oral taxon 876 str. F0540]QAA32718.1 XRE family transcriptional regulator [Clostridium manihotivorum]
MSNISKLLGERIKSLRKEYGWSQEDLANRAGIARSFMGEIERGQASATVESLDKIATAFEIPIEDIFKGLQTSSESKYSLLIDRANDLSTENLKAVLDFLETLYRLKTK